MFKYDSHIYNQDAPGIILPLLFKQFRPDSILDVGCGIGTWLKVAEDNGVSDLLGIDGGHVDRKDLQIDFSKFNERNLEFPFDLQRKFDLVICLEVAEHLSPSASVTLVSSLTSHANVILFSAAIPGQQGNNHINEQWPEYWKEKFLERGYVFKDIIRPLIWDDHRVAWWYRQNIFLVVREDDPRWQAFETSARAFIHPELFKIIRAEYSAKIEKLNTANKKLKKRDILGKIARLFRN